MLCYTGNHKGPAGTWIIITELLSFVNIILNKYFANITEGQGGGSSVPSGGRQKNRPLVPRGPLVPFPCFFTKKEHPKVFFFNHAGDGT